MAWYRSGTVNVTNGSPNVTGSNTGFVANVAIGDGFKGPDGQVYEVANVVSDTQLTLAQNYTGASSNGSAYSVQPTLAYPLSLAQQAATLLATFGAVRDGVGAGLFPDGTVSAPAFRFLSDQDTGFRRAGENTLALVTGGVDRVTLASNGRVGIGAVNPFSALEVNTPGSVYGYVTVGNSANSILVGVNPQGIPVLLNAINMGIIFGGNGTGTPTEQMRIDGSGSLLVGVTTGSSHVIARGNASGQQIAQFSPLGQSGFAAVRIFLGDNGAISSSAACLKVDVVSSTGRSIAAAGTINAGGADYAEYMVKADGCGTIAKGDVCGVNRDGKLVRSWADAVRCVVKTTDPSLVGGDNWAAELPDQPLEPQNAPVAPVPPQLVERVLPSEPMREEGEEDIDFIRRMAAYLVQLTNASSAAQADAQAMAAYQTAAAAYPAEKAAHDAEVEAYERDLKTWEQALEAERVKVDRIAFCGQVPVNVDAATLAACSDALKAGKATYLVAAARGSGIGAKAVLADDMTLPDYMKRLGAVWAIRGEQVIIDVQHG